MPKLILYSLTLRQKTRRVEVSRTIRGFPLQAPSDLHANGDTKRVSLIGILLESPHLSK